jgi:hypothetical protein
MFELGENITSRCTLTLPTLVLVFLPSCLLHCVSCGGGADS